MAAPPAKPNNWYFNRQHPRRSATIAVAVEKTTTAREPKVPNNKERVLLSNMPRWSLTVPERKIEPKNRAGEKKSAKRRLTMAMVSRAARGLALTSRR